MQFGVTEILEYYRCRRRWDFGSSNRQAIEKIVPHTTSLPLGTLVHEALSCWLAYPNEKLVDFYKVAAIAQNEAIIKSYKKATGGVAPDANELDDLHKAMLMGQSMMENYQLYWGKPLPPGFELVSPEQEVSVPIPNTMHDEEWVQEDPTNYPLVWKKVKLDAPVPHFLRGRLDAIILDTQQQRLFVLEHKTYGSRPREAVLRTNAQFLAYHWILTQLPMQLPVGGIAYDGMWKRAAPPKGSELKDLFSRIRIERNPHELAEFEQMLAPTVIEMASNPYITINRTWDGSCDWGCAFNELCFTMSRGEDTNYIRKTLYQPKTPHEAKSYELA